MSEEDYKALKDLSTIRILLEKTKEQKKELPAKATPKSNRDDQQRKNG
jgi:hypothetical protein